MGCLLEKLAKKNKKEGVKINRIGKIAKDALINDKVSSSSNRLIKNDIALSPVGDKMFFPRTNSFNKDDYFSEDQIKYYETFIKEEEMELSNQIEINPKMFKKGDLIGEGSFGKVYQYLNNQNGKFYAVKVLNLEILSQKTKNLNSTIQNEIELLKTMSHDNIIKYYGTFNEGINLYIVLEYCSNGSLLKLLNTFEHFGENVIKKYVIQILNGLEYLHCHNIIHRDIKCANILLDKNGICKLTDFGGAKILKEEISLNSSSLQGTPNWMAPEVIKSSSSTRFSDIWSLGCSIIEMYQGKPPWYEHTNIISVMNCICKAKDPPKFPEGISPLLRDFLEKCLVIEPKKRYNVYQLKRHPFITGEVKHCPKNNLINSKIILNKKYENKITKINGPEESKKCNYSTGTYEPMNLNNINSFDISENNKLMNKYIEKENNNKKIISEDKYDEKISEKDIDIIIDNDIISKKKEGNYPKQKIKKKPHKIDINQIKYENLESLNGNEIEKNNKKEL